MATEKKTVLIVEDEKMIAEAVKAYLDKEGYTTIVAYDGLVALEEFRKQAPDLIVLDRNLPGRSGEDVCKEIRSVSDLPIIMLTAKTAEDDKVEGFSIGADDYLTKPFSPKELVARVQSLLRRASRGEEPLCNEMFWNQNEVSIHFDSLIVKKDGINANLTPNEYKLFYTLATAPQKTFTRDELIEIAFGMEFQGYDRTIDSHIKNLRSKVEDDPANPLYIITVRGVGYRFGGGKPN